LANLDIRKWDAVINCVINTRHLSIRNHYLSSCGNYDELTHIAHIAIWELLAKNHRSYIPSNGLIATIVYCSIVDHLRAFHGIRNPHYLSAISCDLDANLISNDDVVSQCAAIQKVSRIMRLLDDFENGNLIMLRLIQQNSVREIIGKLGLNESTFFLKYKKVKSDLNVRYAEIYNEKIGISSI